jgi:hypothetical protein
MVMFIPTGDDMMQVVPVPADEGVLRGVREPQGRVPGGSGACVNINSAGCLALYRNRNTCVN